MANAERLACDGGTPVRRLLLPYGRQAIDDGDLRAVVDVLNSDWLTTGPMVARFEEAFASAVGAAHAVAVSSGTAALHAAAFVSGAGPGDEIITTPMTFAASANCARYVGAMPVFADVDDRTLNIDPAHVRARLNARTKAIVAVDYSGQPVDLEELSGIAAQAGAVLIEDACHALGAEYRGRRVGSLAAMTVFSTHPVKHITTGEGGVITTNDAALAERLRRFRSHGITTDARMREATGSWFYEMVELGYNYRLTDIQCALGLSQLAHLDSWLQRRRAIVDRYQASLSQVPGVAVPYVLEDRRSAWHLYVIRVDTGALRPGCDRGTVFRALRAENIGVNVHYVPVNWHPYYRALGYGPGDCPISDAAYAQLITLPLFPTMTDADADDVIAAVTKVMKAYHA
ncbi:MAG TPA: UDP-4-amino-4,6-dideoxy-N-acetyl-beta-L-altrosamine transaminase [Vicinamibacterales bacterium]|nr:UDP-4-amino-4,6-dideoxy-N-acetyl-beta-L-altrosamine transaminase [Vicinamibacterales bacterium]